MRSCADNQGRFRHGSKRGSLLHPAIAFGAAVVYDLAYLTDPFATKERAGEELSADDG
jgi:hypothetical protein